MFHNILLSPKDKVSMMHGKLNRRSEMSLKWWENANGRMGYDIICQKDILHSFIFGDLLTKISVTSIHLTDPKKYPSQSKIFISHLKELLINHRKKNSLIKKTYKLPISSVFHFTSHWHQMQRLPQSPRLMTGAPPWVSAEYNSEYQTH